MIVDRHITEYLHSLGTDNGPLLEDLRLFAEDNGVPIIRREMESFLCVLLEMIKPERILEIGTGIGYSACFMAVHSDSVRRIDTIENFPPRIDKAKEVFRLLDSDRVRLIEGDAAEVIGNLEGPYDLIFLDGPKAQYISMLPDLLGLLRGGGALLADNVLQDGELVMSRFVTQRRDRTIHERMREFVWTVTHDPNLTTSVITIGDGVTLSIKK